MRKAHHKSRWDHHKGHLRVHPTKMTILENNEFSAGHNASCASSSFIGMFGECTFSIVHRSTRLRILGDISPSASPTKAFDVFPVHQLVFQHMSATLVVVADVLYVSHVCCLSCGGRCVVRFTCLLL